MWNNLLYPAVKVQEFTMFAQYSLETSSTFDYHQHCHLSSQHGIVTFPKSLLKKLYYYGILHCKQPQAIVSCCA